MHSSRISSSLTRSIAPYAAALTLASTAGAAPPSIRAVAVMGQPAPGASAGTTFSNFGAAEFDGAPSIGADAAVGLGATLSNGGAGFWIDRGSGPVLFALSGSQAPGAEPGVVFSQRISEAFIFTPPLLVPGHAVLFNTLSGPGVGFGNDEGVWASGSAGLVLLAREGAPAPGLAGVVLSTMRPHAIDAAGRAILSVMLGGAVVDGNNETIWRAAPGAGLELLAREGDAAPGTGPGVVFASSSGPSAFPIVTGNGRGDLLFQGNLHGPGTSPGNDEALFIRDASGTRLFIREGDPVPGMPGFVFREGATAGFHVSDLSFGDDGHVALTARVGSPAGSASALLSEAGGALTTLVRSGDAAPGTTGTFDLLVDPVMNGRGDVAFLASTAPGAPFPSLGLWVRSGAALRPIAVPGQALPDQSATIQSIQIISGFNGTGFLLFSATLSAPGAAALLFATPAGEVGVVARPGRTLAGGIVSRAFARAGALSDDAHAAFAVQLAGGSSAQLIADLAGAPCYPNCDNSTVAPVLNVVDFACFLNRFAAGDSYANCDGSTTTPALNVLDFGCFLNAFASGCP